MDPPDTSQNTHAMVTRAKNHIFKPKVYLADYKEVEPTSTKETLKHNHWRKAMKEEYSALMKMVLGNLSLQLQIKK